MKLFTPPTRQVTRPGSRFWQRLLDTTSVSVLKVGTSYRTVEEPTNEEVAAADVAYLGGRTYLVTNTEAASLTEAGYGACITSIPTSSGYGRGRYGEGLYGEGEEPTSASPYGSGPYGDGPYGN